MVPWDSDSNWEILNLTALIISWFRRIAPSFSLMLDSWWNFPISAWFVLASKSLYSATSCSFLAFAFWISKAKLKLVSLASLIFFSRWSISENVKMIYFIHTVFPHIVAAATILFWIHKSLKFSYNFLIDFSLRQWQLE